MKIAVVLGKREDADMYSAKAEILKKAAHKRWFNGNSKTYANGEQPYLVFPLLVDMVPHNLIDDVMAKLEYAIIVKNKGHLNSGMHGTYYMLKLLMERNRNDLIYEMVLGFNILQTYVHTNIGTCVC